MNVNFEIINQKGSPAIYSDTYANRPAASYAGRLFISTDTKEIYRDTGTAWEELAGAGSGNIQGSGTANYVPKFTDTETIGNSQIRDDGTSVGVGVAPSAVYYLDIGGSQRNTLSAAGGISIIQASGGSTIAHFGVYNSASGNAFLFSKNSTTNEIYSVGKIQHKIFDGTSNYFTSEFVTGNWAINSVTDAGYKLDVNGTGNFSGALTGTAATFSSNVTVGGYLTGQGTNPGGLGGSRYILDWFSGSMRIFSYGADASTNGGFLFNSQRSDGSNSTNYLSIATTGAATFSSSVTATSLIKSGGTSAQYLMADGSVSTLTNPVTGTGTTNYVTKWTSSSAVGNSLIEDNGTVMGINGAVATHIFQIYSGGTTFARVGITNTSTGNTASDGLIFQQETINSIIKNQENGYLAFGVNGAETNLVIAQGGNVLIGTTTDAGYKLDVNGTGNFSGQLRSIASGAYAGGSEQIGAGIVNSAALAAVPEVARFSNNGSGYVTKIILSDNNIADAVISYEPSGAAALSLLGFGSGTAKQLTIDGNGKVTLTGTLSGTSATFSSTIAIGNTVAVSVATPSTHKVTMVIGGVTYYLLASNV